MPNFDQTASDQITTYATQRYPKYLRLAQLLREVLCSLVGKVAPHAIVQTRPKSVSSFAEKIFRKPHNNPCGEFTDLCGGRVITHTTDEVGAIIRLLKDRFEIDAENSVDHTRRLKSREFGYRSVHYIVRFGPQDFIPEYGDLQDMENPRAEIQVRTLLEHAWADVSYEYAYKPDFEMPQKLQREIFCAAALLEESDDVFSRVRNGLAYYAGSYGTYMSPDEISGKIGVLRFVLDSNAVSESERVELAVRIGSLAMELDQCDVWTSAVGLLSEASRVPSGSDNLAVFLRLGVLKCRLHKPDSVEYIEGQDHLKKAIQIAPYDIEAHIALACTFEDSKDSNKAREYYSTAFSMDPSNPRVLSSFLGLEFNFNKDPSMVHYFQPIIRKAISRSHEQIDVKVNLPWAFYDAGFFHVLLEEWEPALTSYCKALELSHTGYVTNKSAELLRKLASYAVSGNLQWNVQLALVLLELCSKAKFGGQPDTPYDHNAIIGPVVIISGSNTHLDEVSSQLYKHLIRPFLLEFKGTIITEGINFGISRIIRDIFDENPHLPSNIKLIGYVPRGVSYRTPDDIHHYENITRVNDVRYSPQLPLQKWSDILRSGISLADVKLLGIGGDEFSGFEYLMALVLGVEVGLLQGSGGRAQEILNDESWKQSNTLLSLPQDPLTIYVFVLPEAKKLENRYREGVAKVIHENYRTDQLRESAANMSPWEELPESLKESNYQQAEHIAAKLRLINCEICKQPEGYDPIVRKLKAHEIDAMAELEHARWNCERLKDGWEWGREKSIKDKKSPYIVSWEKLPDNVKEWDRKAVGQIPQLLAAIGLQIKEIGG